MQEEFAQLLKRALWALPHRGNNVLETGHAFDRDNLELSYFNFGLDESSPHTREAKDNYMLCLYEPVHFKNDARRSLLNLFAECELTNIGRPQYKEDERFGGEMLIPVTPRHCAVSSDEVNDPDRGECTRTRIYFHKDDLPALQKKLESILRLQAPKSPIELG